jgi:hypothetical protein
MFAQLHTRNGSNSMYIIGYGNVAGIDIIFLFAQHFPEILVVFGIRPSLSGVDALPVVDITECDNIYIGRFREIPQVIIAFASCANGANIQLITGRYISAAQYMAGNNKKACGCERSVPDKLSSGIVWLVLTFHVT